MSRLPDFVIVGAARCGTSSLHAYLREHPQVCMSRDKEPDYFSLGDLPAAEIPSNGSPYRALTLRDYERQFEAAGNALAVGEASPTYLVYPRSAERMRALIPDAKLICILRDPVERAYSHYAFARKMGTERCPDFEQALAAEEARSREDPTLRFTYVRGSLYHDGLLAFVERFPRERILVLQFEAFARDPAGTMRGIHRFIGVDEHFVADVGVRHNRSLMPRHALVGEVLRRARRLRRFVLRRLPPRLATRIGDVLMHAPPGVAPAVRARLLPRFVDDVRRLEVLLDRDLSAWRTP